MIAVLINTEKHFNLDSECNLLKLTFLFLIELLYIQFYLRVLAKPQKEQEKKKKKTHFIFNYEVLLVRQQISGPNKLHHKKFNLNEHISFNPLKLLS